MDGCGSDQTGGASGKAAKPRNRGQCVTVRSYVVDEVGQTASAYIHAVFHVLNSHILCILPTARICVFCKQHNTDCVCNDDVMCAV
jgi:hypothetical protein